MGRGRLVVLLARHDRAFNAGKQVGPVPPHITLDLDAGTADWFGVFDSESVSLS